MPLYLLHVIVPPKSVMCRIERLFNKFLWSAKGQRRIHWECWEDLCYPVEEGVLGMRRLQDLVNAMSLKLWWRFHTVNNLWSNFMNCKYGYNSASFSGGASVHDSPIWKRLSMAGRACNDLIRWKVGCGKINFWHDIWVDDSALSSTRVDHPLWSLTAHGGFTMYSAWNRVRQVSVRQIQGKGICMVSKCYGCNDIESLEHLFLFCPSVSPVRNFFAAMFSVSLLVDGSIRHWLSAWFFSGDYVSTEQVYSPKMVRWINPEEHCFKLNVDGSFQGNSVVAGGVGILRDWHNNVSFFFFLPLKAKSALHAEILTLYHGLTICKDRGIGRLWIEMDALSVINLVQNRCIGEANQVADHLAALGSQAADLHIGSSLADFPSLRGLLFGEGVCPSLIFLWRFGLAPLQIGVVTRLFYFLFGDGVCPSLSVLWRKVIRKRKTPSQEFGFMAKNKKKSAAKKCKTFEELRPAKPQATSTSPPPSPKQRIAAYDSSGSCASKLSHSNGSQLPNYEEFEDSEEEEGEFVPALSKEDEAYASKFFFTSPMSERYAKDCLVLHESQAQPLVQVEAVMTVASFGSDSPLLLSAGTAPMAAPRPQASSPPFAMENFIVGAGVVGSAKGKEKEDVVSLQLQAAAAGDVGLLDRFCPFSSIAKEMDAGVSPSPSAKENAVILHGNGAVALDLVTVGDAPLALPMAALHDSHDLLSSLPIAKVLCDNATTSNAVATVTSKLGKEMGSKAAQTDCVRIGAAKTAYVKVGAVKPGSVKSAATHRGVLGKEAAMNGSKDGHASNGKWKDLFSSNRRADTGTKLKVDSAPEVAKAVSATEKVLVKRWVPVKKVAPDQVKPNEQQPSDEPSQPLPHEEATRPAGCEEQTRPNDDVQVFSSLNESIDEQRVDPMQMETDAGEWTVVKKRNGKSKVADDKAVVVFLLGAKG
ncbi:hypothetical protein OIU84_015493 [Salix udensis]|uniref:RNase H type-1 domain-containing protein n=1 Tax=Salix udensis TaxID=889485 RepID=A0AAD6J7Y9_9ROSI|nr:hypothetical protein OIU84_015493 [Salix udensis]